LHFYQRLRVVRQRCVCEECRPRPAYQSRPSLAGYAAVNSPSLDWYGLASAAEQAQQLKGWIAPDLLVLDDLFLARRIA